MFNVPYSELSLDDRKKVVQESINRLKSLGIPVARSLYYESIKIDWALEQTSLRNLEKKTEQILLDCFNENSLLQLPEGKYHLNVTIRDNKVTFHPIAEGTGSIQGDWEKKKDFSMRKFNECGIPFEVETSGKFDVWTLDSNKFNVHFTNHSEWYGISLNAIEENYDFILINSNFEFCLLTNVFVRQHMDKFYPTKGNGNLNQLNFSINWLTGAISGYSKYLPASILDKIGVVGIEEYNHLIPALHFEKS